MKKMNELFEQNVYLKEFDAAVLRCDKGRQFYEIVLDQTAFFPEGGGQPADIGTLNDVPVVDVQRVDDTIVHYTKAPVSGQVHGRIDWAHRFDLMQQHSGEHMVSGVIHALYGLENVGFHMSDVITIDFNGNVTDPELVERKVNEAIYQNLPVKCWYPDEKTLAALPYRSKKAIDGAVRIVEIPGVDICACCGTHVSATGEIGLVKILSCEAHEHATRITMICGSRALADYQAKHRQVIHISHALAARPAAVDQAVEKTLNKDHEKSRKIGILVRTLFEHLAQNYAPGCPLVLESIDGLTMNELRNGCDLLNKTVHPKVCMVISQGQYALCAEHSRAVQQAMHAVLPGKGGGSDEMVQGRIEAEVDAVREYFTTLFTETEIGK
ncbi:MAG: alanyl-tRNA editing protein [Catenisphaera adipataccumulans]|jgi:alanyl-tRNA synthetase|uniref:alanyl-tRNA editing protein n=1 Tax=Catenisphaera adipataccumulans TaxID=700500 RepID=UPI003D9009D1